MNQLIAQSIENPILGPGLKGLSGTEFIQGLLRALINHGFIIGVTVFFFILLIGAIQWTTSGGDKGSVESARSRVTNAVVGLFILLALFAIINLVELFFGTNILFFDIGDLIIGGGGGGGGGS